MEDLFSIAQKKLAPLADRMRPRTLDEFLGQEHIVGQGRLLRRAIAADRLTSSIFWGPPGCGKTTLAAVIANGSKAAFEKLNAVTSGVADVREVLKKAEERQKLYGQSTYLLLDECHRWSKSQSDSILPAIEKGIIAFIGSTTENPMVAMTPAIVSRCRLFEFRALTREQVVHALQQAIADKKRGYGNMSFDVEEGALEHIAFVAGGDVRSALNALELLVLSTSPNESGHLPLTREAAEESIQQRALPMDESLYYDMLSAFCKSLRGSDSDAALAWFARLVYAGIDARIIARRLIAHASEDVGMANPTAMLIAMAAMQAVKDIGMPEAKLPLTQAIICLCESPKSNSVVAAMGAALADAEGTTHAPVPVHLRDTSYKGAEKLGFGKGYLYPHDFPDHYVQQEYMPDAVRGKRYYVPSDQGYENKIREIRRTRKKDDQ